MFSVLLHVSTQNKALLWMNMFSRFFGLHRKSYLSLMKRYRGITFD